MNDRFKIPLVFGVLNFGGLYLGAIATNPGVNSVWYTSLNQAPWTPPGFVFGLAWTLIMICFTVYLTVLWSNQSIRKTLSALFGLSWLLNVLWNPVFFSLHQTTFALFLISGLLVLLMVMAVKFAKFLGYKTIWILPYIAWLIIATSLNAYIVLQNP
ncbi:MAG: tryptophan-rich sensory protein [Bacteroidetes bacterium]|nr:tryptophan-rich sensory protein [Bacteroidota bacterium]